MILHARRVDRSPMRSEIDCHVLRQQGLFNEKDRRTRLLHALRYCYLGGEGSATLPLVFHLRIQPITTGDLQERPVGDSGREWLGQYYLVVV